MSAYIKQSFPSMRPLFEIPDELWNSSIIGPCVYASAKVRAYAAMDPAWKVPGQHCGSSGNVYEWEGKVGSVLGQAIAKIYSQGTAEIVSGVFTLNGNSGNANAILRADSYIGQIPSNIPTQSGCAGASAIQTNCPSSFSQSRAANYVTRISPASYWGVCENNSQQESGRIQLF